MNFKKNFTLIMLTLFSFQLFANNIDSIAKDSLKPYELPVKKLKLDLNDSIKIITLPVNNKKSSISENMPWIVALLIGMLSFILNLIITKESNQSNKENLIEQIQSAKEIANTEFKAKLKTENMQEWLDNLREYLSEYLANCAFIRTKMEELKNESENEIYNAIAIEFKEMVKYKVKLLTMLNLSVQEQKKVAEQIVEIFKKSFLSTDDFTAKEHISLENQLLSDMRELVDKHWGKIKNIDK